MFPSMAIPWWIVKLGRKSVFVTEKKVLQSILRKDYIVRMRQRSIAHPFSTPRQ